MAECFIAPVLDTAADEDDAFVPGLFQGVYQDATMYEHGPSGSLSELLIWARALARVVVVHLPEANRVGQYSAGEETAGDLPSLPETADPS